MTWKSVILATIFWASFVTLILACAYVKLLLFYCGMTSSIELVDRGCYIYQRLLIPLLAFDALGLIVSLGLSKRSYAAIVAAASILGTYGGIYLIENWR